MLRLLVCLLLLWSQLSLAAIITGNSHGSVTMEVIYDYQCPHCHIIYPKVVSLQASYPQLKVRWLPVAIINNPLSLEEATTAIAATKLPNGFVNLTQIMMQSPILTDSEFNQLLLNLNLNHPDFLMSRHATWVESVLNEGMTVLNQYQVKAVPFIRIYPTSSPDKAQLLVGEQSLSTLKGAIDVAI